MNSILKLFWPLTISPLFIRFPYTSSILGAILVLNIIVTFKHKHGKRDVVTQTDVKRWLSFIYVFSLIITLVLTTGTIARVIPRNLLFLKYATTAISFILLNAGLLLHTHAILTLGKNFDWKPSASQNQTITAIGPYKLVRHPIYLSYILLQLGFGFLSGRLALTIVLTIPTIIWATTRARIEEKILQTNTKNYLIYASKTPILFPSWNSTKIFICDLYFS